MRNRPGDTGLVARLDSLQHQINELTRRSTRGPMCVVRLGADVEFPARTDVLISASWNATPDTDTDGMWQYAPGGTERSHLRIPAQGRYLIHPLEAYEAPVESLVFHGHQHGPDGPHGRKVFRDDQFSLA